MPKQYKISKNKKQLEGQVDDFYDLFSHTNEPSSSVVVSIPEIIESQEVSSQSRETDNAFFFPVEDEEYEGQISVDVYQTARNIVIKSPIAGVKPEDIDISITNDLVTIRGKREENETHKNADYLFSECFWGNFSRTIVLPTEVDAQKARAKLKNGILTITLPKLKQLNNVNIKVQV